MSLFSSFSSLGGQNEEMWKQCGFPCAWAYFSYFHFSVLPQPKLSMCECLHNESHLRCDLMTRKQHQLAIWYLIRSTPFHTAKWMFSWSQEQVIFSAIDFLDPQRTQILLNITWIFFCQEAWVSHVSLEQRMLPNLVLTYGPVPVPPWDI